MTGSWLRKLVCGVLLPLGAATALLTQPILLRAQESTPAPPADTTLNSGVTLDSIYVQGNARINAAAVRALSGLPGSGTRIIARDIEGAIRRLMASGNFQTVNVYSQGEPPAPVNLIIEVAERPLISRVEFKGLEHVSAKTVRDTVGIREGQPLDPNLVVRTEQMIRQLLAKQGFQVLAVDTSLAPVGQESGYRLTFNVREGPRLSIADIQFEGNQALSDATLRKALDTKREGFFWFRTGKYNPETLQTDLQTGLPDLYASRGYVDFQVLGDTLVIDPATGKAMIRVQVSEGPQYRLGEFKVEGNTRFPTDQLTQLFTTQRRTVLGLPFGVGGSRESGEVFDRTALDAATARVRQMYNNEGYLYAQVEPILERVPASNGNGNGNGSPEVNVTWAISERSPFYINQIRIEGNTFTHESVIRDRLFIFPGDVYNEDRLIQSYKSLSSLGFFETPMPLPDIQPNPDSGVVNIVFHVKEKQTGNINFGTAIGGGVRGGGLSGFLGFTQPNLFGQGKQVELRGEYGYGRNSFQLSYTDPALFGTRNSGTASLFHFSDRYSPFNDGRRIQTGASLRYGFPLFGLFRTRAFVGYSLARTEYQSVEEQCTGQEFSIFCLPTATASNLSLAITRDTRDGQLFPTVGTRQSFTLSQTGGPLGGDGNFQKALTELEWWVPVGRLGGSAPGSRPILMSVGMQARIGTVFGNASRFPFESFFLGGTQFGEQLRGYEESTITPFGYCDRQGQLCPLGSSNRLGNAFLTLTAEYAIRVNDNLSVSLFGDAGNIWIDPNQIDPTRLFRGAGAGVTIVTPFGPLGLDWAYGFDRTNPGWKFHFKLGQGF